MNAFAKALWAIVPNKGMVLFTIAIVCVTMVFGLGLLTYTAFNLEVRGNETIANIFHGHVERLPVFNAESIEANTGMIAIVKKDFRDEVALNNLRSAIIAHDGLLFNKNVRNPDGTFVSEPMKKMWNEKYDNIEKEIDRLERKIKGRSSMYNSLYMVASRKR